MAYCCIPGCDKELSPFTRMRTCATCRGSLHVWEKRRPAEILLRAQRLTKYRARMATFAVVKDDKVSMIDHAILEKRGIMSFGLRRSARKAAAIAAQAKLRDRQRKANAKPKVVIDVIPSGPTH